MLPAVRTTVKKTTNGKMKNIGRHILLALLLLTACTKNPTEELREGEGAVSFAIAMPQSSRAAYDDPTQYPWTHCAIRIYKYTAGDDETRNRELIRRYGSPSEMPASLWLLAGDYSIAVELGSKAEATFDEPTYRGEKDFVIAEGKTTSVEVECRLANTLVKVIYDKTIPATFKETFRTTVAFDETYTQEHVDKGLVPALEYDKTATGYFLLPDDAATLCWRFCGEGEKNGEPLKLEKTGKQEISTQPGVCYELKLKYSKDLGGTLGFTLTLDENPEEVDDPMVFIPNPLITGVGFDLGEPQRFTDGSLVLAISSIADMERVRIEAGDASYEVAAATAGENADGIAVECTDATNMTVSLGAKFFARLAGGDHALLLTAIDQDGGEGQKTLNVRTQGALSLTPTDCWNARGEGKAVVFDPEAGDVKIGFRKVGEENWTLLPAVAGADDIRTAEIAGIEADTRYECRLFFGDEPVNGTLQTATGIGPQVYNAGFEVWTGSSPLMPYTSETDRNDQWWDTGNHGSSTMNKNVTTNVNDPRPGSAGTTSACLNSQFVGLGSFGKFAAGNIFVGKYLGTNNTDGVIGFGKPFAFTYRPRQLKFWYKGTVGSVDYAGGSVSKGDADVNQVYICLCRMDGPHVVDTRYSDTFLNFAANSKTMSYCTSLNGKSSANDRDDGRIIAWAEWNNTQSQADWTEIVLDLHYNEEYEGEVPTYLMLTASASKYGDYFAGSASSIIYLDDMELVY